MFQIAWEAFTPLNAIFGGLMIGASALMLLYTNGKIMGASGIISRAMLPDHPSHRSWRLALLAGLLSAAVLWFIIFPQDAQSKAFEFSTPLAIFAGLLVGVGSVLGSGCTSGHGICGLSRFSHRSLAATAVFFSVAVITASLF